LANRVACSRGKAAPVGVTLIEVMAALIIAAAVSAIGIQYLRPAGETSQQRSCDMMRELLQNDAQRYMTTKGKLPSSDLRELRTVEYAGAVLPTCPVTGEAYSRNRTGIIGCPTHEATRVK
jgi:type II secretory pathway component PulJ